MYNVFLQGAGDRRPVSFFTLRFLLGLAEAGFFPGMILYFTYWFPPSHRARIVAGFMAAIPISIGLGAPISTSLLELDGVLGIAGWRWLFLYEAAPAVIFGIATFFYLTDRPAQADWLEAEEREWLATEMEKERQTVATGRTISVLQSLFNPRVLALAAIHFGQAGVSVGIAVFAAQIIKQLGLTNMQTGFTTAIPYALGTIGMIVWGSYSDRKNERRWNLTASCTTMAVGCLIAGLVGNTYWAVLGLSVATIGLYASQAHLFPLPAVFLTGPALASGIAWVNSVGILGGSASPPIVGWFKDATAALAAGSTRSPYLASSQLSSPPSACARRPRRWFRKRSKPPATSQNPDSGEGRLHDGLSSSRESAGACTFHVNLGR